MVTKAELDEHHRIEDAKRQPTHTPTPWRVEPEKLYRGSHVAGRTPRVVGNGTLIANIWNPEDAALIVRAVNSFEAMREALQQCKDAMNAHMKRYGPTPNIVTAENIAAAALAGAEEAHAKG